MRSLREELTWAARESRRMGREMATDVREQAKQARDEAREQAKQARDEAREQVKQAKEQAREQARQARDGAREGQDRAGQPHDPGGFGEESAAAAGEGPGPEAARRVHEQARRLREEARRARDEAIGAGRLGDPVGAGFRPGDHDWDPPGGSGWGQGPGWTDWPGRRGWEDWARMRGRPGWPGGLDFGTLRDLERVAVQFTSDLRRVAMQSSAAGENVITDLRTILEDALDRIKSEIFGPGHEEAEGKGPGTAGAADSPASSAGDASADAPVADAPVADDTPPAGDAGKPTGKD